MKIVLATHNEDKVREVGQILAASGIEVVSQGSLGITGEVEETGTTFEENSRIKALAAVKATGLPAMADDSGLCVDALGGAPGIYSARFGGEDLPYDKKCAMLFDMLADKDDRTARFVSAAVCCFPNGDELVAIGEVKGKIGYSMVGRNGFGYDPVFIPDGYNCTTAEMSAEEKNAISHRGKAFRLMAEKLETYLKEKSN